MLFGVMVATPQPSAINWSSAGGSGLGGGVKPRKVGAGNAISGIVRPPNIIMTGTGVLASAGTTSVISIATVISGSDELSTWPRSCFPMTDRDATVASAVFVTSHV